MASALTLQPRGPRILCSFVQSPVAGCRGCPHGLGLKRTCWSRKERAKHAEVRCWTDSGAAQVFCSQIALSVRQREVSAAQHKAEQARTRTEQQQRSAAKVRPGPGVTVGVVPESFQARFHSVSNDKRSGHQLKHVQLFGGAVWTHKRTRRVHRRLPVGGVSQKVVF